MFFRYAWHGCSFLEYAFKERNCLINQTLTAAETIDRDIDLFPSDQQNFVRLSWDNFSDQIPSLVQTGGEYGMQTSDQSLISEERLFECCFDEKFVKSLLGRIS